MPHINHQSWDESARFEKFRSKGIRRDKAARIATSSGYNSRKGNFSKYEKWTTDELYKKAVEEGIEGCAHMTKRALIGALREH
jgi:hypothetical protein